MCPNHAKEEEKDFSSPLNLDLSRFIPRLIKDYPNRFDKKIAISAIEEYKKFLLIKKSYVDLELAPSSLVDVIWHSHILDTKRYMEDCNKIFGYYLHHNPSFDPNEEEQTELVEKFNKMLSYYERLFGYSAPMDIWPRYGSPLKKDGGPQCFIPSCCS